MNGNVKKVKYTYHIRDIGCGCCHESANFLEIYDSITGEELWWTDEAPAFCDEEELKKYVVEFHNLQEDEFVVDTESEFL